MLTGGCACVQRAGFDEGAMEGSDAMALLRRWKHVESALPSITGERLRVMNKWLFWLWIFPGVPISIYLRNSVAWVVFLSVYAIIVAHLIEWRQEDSGE
jgi:hypothetical protein